MDWVEFRGREDKLMSMANLIKDYLRGTVLDLGCDAKVLTRVSDKYIGLDFKGRPDILANLEAGIPLKDQSVDCVVAMDVLEHLEKIHRLFDECCRVSRKFVIVGIPNQYEWRFRVMFLVGKRLSGKYGLPLEPPSDRHRWLFSLQEAKDFIHIRAQINGFDLIREMYGYYRYSRFLPVLIAKAGRWFGKKGLNLFACHYSVVLNRRRHGH